jgi:hypothetical protein
VVNRLNDFHAAAQTEDERVQKMADNIASYARQCMTSEMITPFERAFSKKKSELSLDKSYERGCDGLEEV